MSSNWNKIKEKISNNNFIIFGTGFFSELWYQRLVKIGYRPFFFVDNNSAFWGTIIIDGLTCISPTEIKLLAPDSVCLVCVNSGFWEEITKQLADLGLDSFCMCEELTNEYEFICDYFGTDIIKYDDKRTPISKSEIYNGEKIVVYTAIFGGYDNLLQPDKIDPRCDYYCISDIKPDNLGVYNWIPFSSINDMDTDNLSLRNRYCKLLPHRIFPQYDYSVYVDGNIKVKSTLEHLFEQMGGYIMGFFNHPDCNDLYVEAFRFCDQYVNLNSKVVINNQILEYIKMGFPFGFGFVENGVIVRKHNDELCIKVMEGWWSEYWKYATRDQLSFMYAIWNNNLSKKDIKIFGTNLRNSQEFGYVLHNKERQRGHTVFMKNVKLQGNINDKTRK